MKSSAELFWSILTIDITSPPTPLLTGEGSIAENIETCFEMARIFEQKYSRFIPGNYLDTLNTNKNSAIDPEFFSIINLCLKASQMTRWYFDITVLPILENAGYWVSKNKLKEDIWYKNIVLSENKIELLHWVSIDLWSVGKGYMIDKIYKYLDKKYSNFIIDFGGDIRIKGEHVISLEDPNLDQPHPNPLLIGEGTGTIWWVVLDNNSIASSSGNRRQFWDAHHLMNPMSGKSVDDKQTIFLTHKLASFSDIFSTALFVSPIDIAITVLNTVVWLEGMIIMSDGTIHKTKDFIWKK